LAPLPHLNQGGCCAAATATFDSNCQTISVPISTLARPLPSADLVTGDGVDKAHYERSDISVVPAAGVVGEAMVMLTLADAMLDKFGGDTIADTRDALDRYVERISRAPEAPVAGGRRSDAAAVSIVGGDEAGSGGDD